MSVDEQNAPGAQASVAGSISREAVQIVARNTGRGPTRVRTYINDDLVTIVLQDLLTVSERTLVASGEKQPVLEGRRALQASMEDDLTALVERHTERKVIAFLSANHLEPDIEVETFLLERR